MKVQKNSTEVIVFFSKKFQETTLDRYIRLQLSASVIEWMFSGISLHLNIGWTSGLSHILHAFIACSSMVVTVKSRLVTVLIISMIIVMCTCIACNKEICMCGLFACSLSVACFVGQWRGDKIQSHWEERWVMEPTRYLNDHGLYGSRSCCIRQWMASVVGKGKFELVDQFWWSMRHMPKGVRYGDFIVSAACLGGH